MLSRQCHLAAVDRIISFDQDYYVFSIGKDCAFCSFLVYSQLVTMKSIQDILSEDDEFVRVNWYRGHSAPIAHLYRNSWCLISDFVVVQLYNGEVVVWCVSTAQLERRFKSIDGMLFMKDQMLPLCNRRPDLPHLTKNEKEIYDLNRQPHLNCNIMVVDVRMLGDVTLTRQYAADAHNNSNNNGNNNNVRDTLLEYEDLLSLAASSRSEESHMLNNEKEVSRLSDMLSLLLDWGVKPELEQLFLTKFRSLITDIAPCYGFCGDFESMTLLFPIASTMGGRWRIQPKVTAIYMLAINTICMWLMQCVPQDKLAVCSSLISYYHLELPDQLHGFVEPSRNTMARYCLNSITEVRSAGRMLLQGIVARMTDDMRDMLIRKWKKRFCIPHHRNAPSLDGVYTHARVGSEYFASESLTTAISPHTSSQVKPKDKANANIGNNSMFSNSKNAVSTKPPLNSNRSLSLISDSQHHLINGKDDDDNDKAARKKAASEDDLHDDDEDDHEVGKAKAKGKKKSKAKRKEKTPNVNGNAKGEVGDDNDDDEVDEEEQKKEVGAEEEEEEEEESLKRGVGGLMSSASNSQLSSLAAMSISELQGEDNNMDEETFIPALTAGLAVNGVLVNKYGKVPLSVLLGAVVICIIHGLQRNPIEDLVATSVINTLVSVLKEQVFSPFLSFSFHPFVK
ncbi:nucleolin [Reticulomyxa filosa]|uniref:Nucleolin n=1 Tax=Reticulomyxa filosa TaxID=46433 RepID=X6NJA2_RETFI|nr:nucleolin [Reticulomyxa filosa]|eukprot:ETO25412.1 nucleolin [Reticulomyxa filosa]